MAEACLAGPLVVVALHLDVDAPHFHTDTAGILRADTARISFEQADDVIGGPALSLELGHNVKERLRALAVSTPSRMTFIRPAAMPPLSGVLLWLPLLTRRCWPSAPALGTRPADGLRH